MIENDLSLERFHTFLTFLLTHLLQLFIRIAGIKLSCWKKNISLQYFQWWSAWDGGGMDFSGWFLFSDFAMVRHSFTLATLAWTNRTSHSAVLGFSFYSLIFWDIRQSRIWFVSEIEENYNVALINPTIDLKQNIFHTGCNFSLSKGKG